MAVDKVSVSFDPDLGESIRAAAQRSGKPVSAWLAEAAGVKLRNEALAVFLERWESDNGPLTAEEITRAENELGFVRQ